MPFNIDQEVEVRVVAPDGHKTATVKYPSDEQWITRMKAQRTIIHDLGRGQSETQIPDTGEADFAMFDAVRVDKDGPTFDSAEAAAVMRRLSLADVGEAVRDGNCFRLPLKVLGAETEHVLGMPSERQLLEYRRTAVRIIEGRHGKSEMRIDLAPAGHLYDELKQSSAGYVGEVPIIHKSAVVAELVQVLREIEEEPDPANFPGGQSTSDAGP